MTDTLKSMQHEPFLAMLCVMAVSKSQNIAVLVTGWALSTDTTRIIASPLKLIGFVLRAITNYIETSNGVLAATDREKPVDKEGSNPTGLPLRQ